MLQTLERDLETDRQDPENDRPDAKNDRQHPENESADLENTPEVFARKVEAPAALPLTDIQLSAENPRLNFDFEKLDELTESIRLSGVLQPILVWRTPSEAPAERPYTVIAGERRYRAAEKAGLTEIPVIVSKAKTAEEAYVESVLENIQREPLDMMAMAHVYHNLMEQRHWSQDQISKRIHGGKVSIGVISNTGRLTKLPTPVQGYFQEGKLTLSHGILLLKALDRTHASPHLSIHKEAPVIELAEECVQNGWTTKSLDYEVEHRFPKPKEAALPLDVEEQATQDKFSAPGPQASPGNEAPQAIPNEFVGERQIEMTDEEMTDEEWEASARPKDADSRGDDQRSDDEQQEVETEPEHAQDSSEDDGSESEADGSSEVSPAQGAAAVAEHPEASASSTDNAADEDEESNARAAVAPAKVASAGSAPAAKTEAAKPVAGALPAGFVTAIVKEADFQKAQELGLWPLAAAIQKLEDAEDHVKAEIDAESPAPPSVAMVLAGSAATRLAEINATAGTILRYAETQLLNELFPERETTGPDHIVAVLVTARMREMTGQTNEEETSL